MSVFFTFYQPNIIVWFSAVSKEQLKPKGIIFAICVVNEATWKTTETIDWDI